MLNSRKILVVEDDENIRDLCSEVLRVAGYQVDTARHGLEGLDRLRKTSFRYDLVISDMNMPGLGGMDLFRAAVKDMPGLRDRFLFMTGNPERVFGRAAVEGFSCLAKPFRISELIGSVEKLMEKALPGVLGHAGGKRSEGRLELVLACHLMAGGSRIAARTVDISPHGIKVRYPGGNRLAAASCVELSLGIGHGVETEKRSSVAWSAEEGGYAVSGLRFDEPVPVSSIINATARLAGELERIRP